MPNSLGWMVEPTSPRNRSPYQNNAFALMREGVLDAMQRLLVERKWSTITMADVAKEAGISRGTLYNEFGTRRGLARSYALRLTDSIITGMESAVETHPGDGYGTLRSAFSEFFARADSDPLVCALRTEDAPNDLLRMITVESQFIVDYAAEHLAAIFERSWVRANAIDANVLGQTIARAALSFLALPPIGADDAAKTIAHVLAPFVTSIGRERR
ncbi:MAG: TetR/AcrR family transcriptional regulator [Mycobacterium sp.]|uniref:TetR family transcriptional regulator n=2 Tax=Mycobacteriaceae TaxID=1762 RepID=A0A1A6BNI9_MYCGO|nr:TetR/AcrR family transcriptional regulator [Mycobacterium sp.]MBX9979332.1 TetR family transcriptional regulator [Mycobacterium gordonae]MCV7009322.1 TetR/AcrR family transcriptional regulator [Mycobacterium gordonae]OBS03908.1 TetR family transcriptional regulator [Mycobacterium gordonae]ODR23432.1 TetR family transcriptional regulator [Mycobacterium gordonae]